MRIVWKLVLSYGLILLVKQANAARAMINGSIGLLLTKATLLFENDNITDFRIDHGVSAVNMYIGDAGEEIRVVSTVLTGYLPDGDILEAEGLFVSKSDDEVNESTIISRINDRLWANRIVDASNISLMKMPMNSSAEVVEHATIDYAANQSVARIESGIDLRPTQEELYGTEEFLENVLEKLN